METDLPNEPAKVLLAHRYSCQTLELDHSLKPFIPDFIPAVGDIDAFLKVPTPLPGAGPAPWSS